VKNAALIIIVVLLFSLLASCVHITPTSMTIDVEAPIVNAASNPNGPRSDTLNIKYYSSSAALYGALKSGEVDLTDIVLNSTQMQDAFNDTNIRTAISPEDSMYEFDFNNNATTPTYPSWTNPTAYKGFRQGIACLVDKAEFVSSFPYSTRIDTPIPRPIGDWWVDWSVSQYDSYGTLLGNYPYEYNSTTAAQYFDQSGFVQGNHTNPDFNGDFQGSAQYLRVYPLGHPKAGQDLDPLIFIIRNDDPVRLQAGRTLTDYLRFMGVPVNATELPSSSAKNEAMQKRNYHIYTGAWVVPSDGNWMESDSQFPVSLLDPYSSSNIGPGGFNYPQFRNATYDQLLQQVDSPSDLGVARNAALNCQKILIQEAVCAWLCSRSQVMGYRNLSEVTNLKGGRIDNQWTFLKAAHGSSTDYGVYVPASLNVITDGSLDCLDRIYDTLLSYCPYDRTPGNVFEEGDRGGDMPWLARDWDIGTWESPYSPGVNLTKLTFDLRAGVRWHDGVQLNSTDVKFTIEYLQGLGDISWLSSYVSDVHHVTCPDALTVEVYENVSSVRTLDSIGELPILPKHVFQNIVNVTGYTPGASEGHLANETLIGCGPWKYAFSNSTMLCLEANRDYFMETPSEAEVDFRYDWKLGCWAVDAMDATMVGEAFGSHSGGLGGEPSANWEPGCDMNGDGVVDAVDLVLVNEKFNTTCGASATRSIAEPPNCAVYVELAQNSVLLGQSITGYVKLRNLDRLSGLQFKLNYDNTLLNCLNLNMSQIFSPNDTPENVVNQTTGLIWVCTTSVSPAPQVGGNIKLATITFNTTQSGSTILHLWDTELARHGAPMSACQPLSHQAIDSGMTIGVLTPTGTSVTVTPAQNAKVTFTNVTTQGFTTLNATQPPTTQFVSAVCNEVKTNASYNGNVSLQFAYNPAGLSLQDQQAMKLWLWNDSSASWVDITTSVNTTSHIVYGVSPHLSVFGITRDLGMTGDLGVQGTTTVSIPSAPPPPPHNLSVLEYYQINTTKNLGTPINLSLAYNPGNIQLGQEIFTQMWVWNESSTSWVDITTNVNTTTHTVYGVSPHLSVFGITNLQSAPDGITVININCPKTVVCQGYNATISFTICNQGDFTQQNFNVLLYCNTTLLAIYPITQLEQYGQIALSYNWTTTNWIKGNYSINTCSNSIRWIKVTIVGDVNGDGKVNLIDVFSVALAYGSYPGPPPWNPNCDINNDGKINLIDYFTAALNYGKTDP